MRIVMMVVAVLIMLPSALSLGIVVPQEVSSGTIDLDVGEEETITFLMKASDETGSAEFFIQGTEGVYVNGKEAYTEDVTFEPFGAKEIDVTFSAREEGKYTVVWGYTQKGTNDGLQIGQKVQDEFIVTVDVNTVRDARAAILLGNEEGSGSSGGVEVQELSEQSDLPSDEDVILADISTQGSSLSEAVVDTSVANKQVSVTESNNGGSEGSEEGKGMLLMTMSLGVVTIGLLGGAIVYTGGEV